MAVSTVVIVHARAEVHVFLAPINGPYSVYLVCMERVVLDHVEHFAVVGLEVFVEVHRLCFALCSPPTISTFVVWPVVGCGENGLGNCRELLPCFQGAPANNFLAVNSFFK